MQKLHLVGFTTDQKGLILSARRGARSGSFHLPVDESLAEAVEEVRAKQAEAEAERVEEVAASRPARVESALTVREIQARLRQGRSVSDVAKAAGVDAEWIDRFAAPVLAERAQVIALVRSASLKRARLGPSEHPIDESVQRNLADRNVAVSPEEFAEGWNARQLADGRWVVRFRYRYRNRDQVLRFDLHESDGSVIAADRVSAQLGYVTPTTPRPTPSPRPRPSPPAATADRRPPKRATVTVGFRPDDVAGRATSRAAKERERASDAMRKAAVQAAAEAERAAARRAKEKAAEVARREREAKAEEARKERERAAAERAKAAAAKKKAAEAKKRAAERAKAKAAKQAADQARRAEAALRAAERKEAARRKAAAEATRKKAKKPAAKAAKPAAKATRPAAKATKPAPKATRPAAKATKPAAKAMRPVAKVSKPAAKATRPVAKVSKPAPKATRPVPKATEPAVKPAVPAAKSPSRPTPNPARAPEPQPTPAVEPFTIASSFMDDDATGDVKVLGPFPRPTEAADPWSRVGTDEPVARPDRTDAGTDPTSWVDAASPPNGRARERAPGEQRTRPLRAT